LEKVLLPEVKDALKLIDEQFGMMEREETIRTRWAHKLMAGEKKLISPSQAAPLR
jgi:vacuolar-type H+-ATPase subunit D/Vma8